MAPSASPIKKTIEDRNTIPSLTVKPRIIPASVVNAKTKTAVTNTEPATGKGKRKNNKNRKKHTNLAGAGIQSNKPLEPKATFLGECKKDLKGVTIIWSPNKQNMTKQFTVFTNSVITVSGKISEEMGISIAQQSKLSCTHFMPEPEDDSEWTNDDGTIDEDKKKFVEKLNEFNSNMKAVAASLAKYALDWKTMFPWIFGQLCTETQQRLMRSKNWASISAERDPGKLMKLLQVLCLHGSDAAYPVEILLNALSDYVNRKQGGMTPTEFSDVTSSNLDVFSDLAGIPEGRSLYGYLPTMQQFIIDKFPDEFSFELEDLNSQSEKVIQLLHAKCEEAALACHLTIKSNPTRSAMNIKVHENALTNNPNAFAMDRATAVDQLIGYEELKRKASNAPRAATNNSGGNKHARQSGGDTTEAIVLVEVSDTNDGVTCWHCNEPGHYRNECPKLSVEERAILAKRRGGNQNGGAVKDNITTAVLSQLSKYSSDDTVEDESEDESEVESEVESNNDKTPLNTELFEEDETFVEEDDVVVGEHTYSFTQYGSSEYSDDINDHDTVDSDDNHDEENVVVENAVGINSRARARARDILQQVLTAVAEGQHKSNPHSWVNAVMYKLSLIGVIDIHILQQRLPTLNQRLRSKNQTAFHRTTLAGISSEVTKSLMADFRQGQA